MLSDISFICMFYFVFCLLTVSVFVVFVQSGRSGGAAGAVRSDGLPAGGAGVVVGPARVSDGSAAGRARPAQERGRRRGLRLVAAPLLCLFSSVLLCARTEGQASRGERRERLGVQRPRRATTHSFSIRYVLSSFFNLILLSRKS